MTADRQITECYGDCPTNPATCTNPCKFEGRAQAPAEAHGAERDPNSIFQTDGLPERDTSKPAEQQGLFRKFIVTRTDGSDKPGGKHENCEYFVLDVGHDRHAAAALWAYAQACKDTHPDLSADLIERYELTGPNVQPKGTETTRSQRLAEAGFTRRPSWKSLPGAMDEDQATAPEAKCQAEPVAVLETPDGVIDLRAIAEQAGISMDCWEMGAASLAHSEGVHGVTREHLERFAALYGFACWNAALAANPPNMQGFVGRALDSLLQAPAVVDAIPAVEELAQQISLFHTNRRGSVALAKELVSWMRAKASQPPVHHTGEKP